MSDPMRLKVLLAHISPEQLPSFVESDLRILESEFVVTPFRYRRREDALRLAAKVATHQVIVSWFAWDNAFWGNRAARILGHGSVTIAGGFDVVAMPEIGYGNLLSPESRRRTRDALRSAGVVLAVSRSIADNAVSVSGRKDIRVAYHGFDAARYPPPGEKKRTVLTVGALTESNLKRKGIRTFARAASFLPEVPFLIAGAVEEEALNALGPLPSNLSILGRLSDADLLDAMEDAAVYVQVSAHEGFGCSLAEAMLCGCIPVVTDRGAIPEVVGDTGRYVPYDEPKETAIAIGGALDSGGGAGARARDRIVRLFPIENRRKALLAAVREAAGSQA